MSLDGHCPTHYSTVCDEVYFSLTYTYALVNFHSVFEIQAFSITDPFLGI